MSLFTLVKTIESGDLIYFKAKIIIKRGREWPVMLWWFLDSELGHLPGCRGSLILPFLLLFLLSGDYHILFTIIALKVNVNVGSASKAQVYLRTYYWQQSHAIFISLLGRKVGFKPRNHFNKLHHGVAYNSRWFMYSGLYSVWTVRQMIAAYNFDSQKH